MSLCLDQWNGIDFSKGQRKYIAHNEQIYMQKLVCDLFEEVL